MAATVASAALGTRPGLAARNETPANVAWPNGDAVWVHTFAALSLARIALAPLQGSASVIVDGRSDSCQTVVADAGAHTLALDDRSIAEWQQCEISARSPFSVSAWPLGEASPREERHAERIRRPSIRLRCFRLEPLGGIEG